MTVELIFEKNWTDEIHVDELDVSKRTLGLVEQEYDDLLHEFAGRFLCECVLYICMCVCIHIMYMYIYVCMYCIYMYTYIYIYISPGRREVRRVESNGKYRQRS